MSSLPNTMRGVTAKEKGGPEMLSLGTFPVPEPRPGEVLIEVAYAGVCRPDIMQRRGVFSAPPGASEILGLEVAGAIVACGPEVKELAPGDRVAALLPGGGYAQYAVADARCCLRLPGHLAERDCAALPEALFTIWHNLFELGRLACGETVLIHGGASGNGTIAIQLADAAGATVFATCGTKEKAALLRKLGCAHPIVHRSQDFVSVIGEMRAGRGVDVVLDIVGGSYVPRNLEVLGPGGRHVSLAFMESANITLDFTTVMRKSLTLTSSTLRPKPADEKARLKRAIERHVWPLIETGRVRPVIHAELPLAEAAEAHRILEASEQTGKVVLRC
ncbi:MAG: NAD(P)H-quinone oxidoreductase [Parvibaculaceae bacterium]